MKNHKVHKFMEHKLVNFNILLEINSFPTPFPTYSLIFSQKP